MKSKSRDKHFFVYLHDFLNIDSLSPFALCFKINLGNREQIEFKAHF